MRISIVLGAAALAGLALLGWLWSSGGGLEPSAARGGAGGGDASTWLVPADGLDEADAGQASGSGGTAERNTGSRSREVASGASGGRRDVARANDMVARDPGLEESDLSAQALALAQAEPVEVVVRVTDGSTGRVVEDAVVHLASELLEEKQRTDKRGQVELPWSSGHRGELVVSKEGYALVRRPRVLPGPTEGSRRFGVTLWRSAVLVLDPVAVDGASGEMTGFEWLAWRCDHEQPSRWTRLKTRPTRDGQRWLLEGLAPGEFAVAARTEQGFAPLERGIELSAGAQTIHSLRLQSLHTLRGTVARRDAARSAVVGARVGLLLEEREVPRAYAPWLGGFTQTDGEGRFQLAGVTAGEHTLRLDGPFGADLETQIAVREGAEPDPVELILPALSSVEGRVVGPTGEPLAGAGIRLTVVRGMDAPETRSDGDGLFRLDRLPAKTPLELGIERPEASPDLVRGVRLPIAGLDAGESRVLGDLRLGAGGVIAGRVLGEEQQPLVGASVRWNAVAGSNRVGPAGSESVSTGAGGEFRLEGLAPGAFVLDARQKGRLSVRTRDTLGEGQELTGLEIVLVPEFEVRGAVVDEAGNAIANLGVELMEVRSPDQGGSAPKRSEIRRLVNTNRRGEFLFRALIPGSYELDVVSEDWQLSPFSNGQINLDADLDPPSYTGNWVAVPALREARGSVRVEARDARSGAALLAMDWQPDSMGEPLREGAMFRLTGVRPGTIDLRLRAAGYLPIHRPGVQIHAGAEVDLGRLDFTPVTRLVVRLVDRDGAPAADWTVELVPEPPAAGGPVPPAGTRTPRVRLIQRAPGTYRFAYALPGGYRLRARSPDGVAFQQRIEVGTQAEQQLELLVPG